MLMRKKGEIQAVFSFTYHTIVKISQQLSMETKFFKKVTLQL